MFAKRHKSRTRLGCEQLEQRAMLAAEASTSEPTLSWGRQFGTDSCDYSKALSMDGLGDAIYIAGSTGGSLGEPNAGGSDATLTKFDTAGTLLWIRQFGTAQRDWAQSVATDSLGNIYVAGGTEGSLAGDNAGQTDVFLSKFDASGTLLWTRQFGTAQEDHAGSRDLQGAASSKSVATDSLGSIYVTGITYGSLAGDNAGTPDAFLTKFDASGTLLWHQQWNTPNNLDVANGHETSAVSADSWGNVYVAGQLNGDAFLTKLDAAGTLFWTKQFGKPGNFEGANAVSVDGLGGVYIAGTIETRPASGSSYGDKDPFLSKFDATGTLLWTKQFGTDWEDCISDGAKGLSLDSLGNIYVAGTVGFLAGNKKDAFLTKFEASGTLLWTEQFGTEHFDEQQGVLADSHGNIYVTGYTYASLFGENNGCYDMYLAKFRDIEKLMGDFDLNGELNAGDIDLLSIAVREGPYDQGFDLNLDTILDQEDRRVWVEELAGTYFGDADLNGTVEFDDFVLLANAYGTEGGWESGDFDGSGDVAFEDFVILANNFGKSALGLDVGPESLASPWGK